MNGDCQEKTAEKIAAEMKETGQRAKAAARILAGATTEMKNSWLLAMADALEADEALILAENAKDITSGRLNGLDDAMLDRLLLTPARIKGIANAVRDIVKLDDPVGHIHSSVIRPNGLRIDKVSTPIGVIGIIYESRPNVTVDAAALCLKSGNAVILRGGSEAIHSNLALGSCIVKAGTALGMPKGAIQIVRNTDRAAVSAMLKLSNYIDLIIPRGGEGLIRSVTEQSLIPVIKHYKGICHIFVDAGYDTAEALKIIENAKCQRPGVCNALETLLIHREIAPSFVPKLMEHLKSKGVEMRGDEEFCALAKGGAVPAVEEDWGTEYLALILSARIVSDVKEAIAHINQYSSGHSESILTNNTANAEKFLNEIDSAAVYLNASTRFTDGGEFGMGAEMGISTDKIHVRGPMGLAELTSYKYKIYGNGQIR